MTPTSRVAAHTHPGGKSAASHTHDVDVAPDIAAAIAAHEAKYHTVVVPPPVDPPPAPAPFPWATLQAAIDATPAGGTIDATGRTFNETVTIQKPLTIKGGTIDGQNIRQQWVRVWGHDVTLTDMAFKNAAKGAYQTGSIDVSGAMCDLIRLTAVGGCYAVLRLWSGSTDALVHSCDFSGAPMGILSYESHRSIIAGGRFHHMTGTASLGNESGGMKLCKSDDILVKKVQADHNVGPGIWLDVYDSRGQVVDCDAHDNTRCGVMVEIQDGGAVTGNTVYRNAVGNVGNAYEMNGGIFISSSRGVAVTGNTAAWNGTGTSQPPAADITVVSQDRDPKPHDGVTVTGNVLRKAPVFYSDTPSPTPVLTPNTIVADTDARIAALR